MTLSLPVLTNSRMKAARACLRYDKLRYRLGYRPTREPSELRFGSLVHRGLEAWWNGWLLPQDERLALTLAAVSGEADQFDRVKAEELLAAYHCRWFLEPLEVIGVETEFLGPLVNPLTGAESRTFRRSGKVDALAFEPSTHRKLLVEHKTSAEDIRQGSNYWLRLRMDPQISTYYEGARFLGHEVDGCIYDVIAKPKLRPAQVPIVDEDRVKIVRDRTGERVRTKDGKKWRETADAALGYVLQTRAETPDEFRLRLAADILAEPGAYFQRGEVVRLESEMREALLDDWHFAITLRDSIREDRAPRNPDACVRYGRTCEFFGVCTGTESLDDQTRFVRSENVHPELGGITLPPEFAGDLERLERDGVLIGAPVVIPLGPDVDRVTFNGIPIPMPEATP
jgi:hypothetical protein